MGFEGLSTLLFELPGAPFRGDKAGVSWSWPFTAIYSAEIENAWISPSILHSPSRNVQAQPCFILDCVWNVMAHAQKPDFVFRRNGRVHLIGRGASVQSTTGSRGVRISGSNAGYTIFEVVWSVLATHSIRQFPLHYPYRASLRALTFQLDSTLSHVLCWILVHSLHYTDSTCKVPKAVCRNRFHWSRDCGFTIRTVNSAARPFRFRDRS